MSYLRRVVFLFALLCIPSLTFAQTVFDVSGTLSLANGTLGGVTVGAFSGTLTINPHSFSDYLDNWNIAMPSLTGPSGVVGAFTFTPSNSSAFAVGASTDAPFEILITRGQTGLNLEFPCFAFQSTPCISFVPGAATSFSSVPGVTDSGYLHGGSTYQVNGQMVPVVPEPSTLVLMGSGVAGIAGIIAVRRRKRAV